MWKIKGKEISFGGVSLGSVKDFSLESVDGKVVLNASIVVDDDVVFVGDKVSEGKKLDLSVDKKDLTFASDTIKASYAKEVEMKDPPRGD